MTEQEQWYSNKDLYEMMVELSKGLEATNANLNETRVMIRDYNGLRETINTCVQRLDRHEASEQGEFKQENTAWAKVGYITGIVGAVAAVLAVMVVR